MEKQWMNQYNADVWLTKVVVKRQSAKGFERGMAWGDLLFEESVTPNNKRTNCKGRPLRDERRADSGLSTSMTT
jgi:hypothetical protein